MYIMQPDRITNDVGSTEIKMFKLGKQGKNKKKRKMFTFILILFMYKILPILNVTTTESCCAIFPSGVTVVVELESVLLSSSVW